ncbi:TIGR02452 family protein [Elizabethkingia meningoseptica]|uniref:TIGR02452 family protein n=1 Tax=Elizabethkingia meningoseptica TaxID=238 RepID=A0A1T3F1C6_ELIME|nr:MULTISPECIES: TIGR02452 family protein [Elizabethkingia]AQX11856.1 TIGR02452 family protein [Elizabethkingia meningoseptica]MBG0513304.1 TIGR02452 family protein [Elizabethkingia meningoseptica]MDE5434659.1 TIGR02452 family protein [Elizabethkingia meningoseptica]MDE5449482.1 TIGR02452 family protein [Elizabethkingia meningoseptica]MDE5472545.1 TIGR02452 family protein [Elizabethkingia meningoseptica]
MTNKEMARDTLEILTRKYYTNKENERISIEKELKTSKEKTRFYTTTELSLLAEENISETLYNTQIEVRNCSSLDAILQLSKEENQELIMCLNFASAKNPGGGFINGAEAQEESLARVSGLYESQLEAEDFYKIHRGMKSCFYTDNMIYSPGVPVFRNQKGELLSRPVLCNFITSAAVNAGVVKQREPDKVTQINEAMKERIDKMLALALEKKNETLILGAWGCGVFRNTPQDIAQLFSLHLKGKYKNKFKRIVFAVLTKNEVTLQLFEDII